jgi:DNA mismatch endonuclease (patch repair protein)
MDRLSSEKRSSLMSRVRTKDTEPELRVRSALHRLGYRYSLHRKDLPGCPDLVFSSRRKVIFVHGCFWHGHTCPRGKLPATNAEFWEAKISKNKARDERTLQTLNSLGWKAFVVWECEIRSDGRFIRRLTRFLN